MSRLTSTFLLVVLVITVVTARVAIADPCITTTTTTTDEEESFSCENRAQGLYANVYSHCRMFHRCVPIVNQDNTVLCTKKYTFTCGKGTIFDQKTLTCTRPEDAASCTDAAAFFQVSNTAFLDIPNQKA